VASSAVSAATGVLDILLLGPVGAGKGTQARRIAQRYGIPHIASGDLLRKHIREGTPLGQEAQAYMESGALVPDDLVIGMILDRMHQPDATNGVLLDGFPRTVAQAQALDAELADKNRSVKLALYLRVPPEVLLDRAANRWNCRVCGTTYDYRVNPPAVAGVCDREGGELFQRADDRPAVVTERIRVYLRDTEPVVSYYRARGILREVDGTVNIAGVTAELQRWIEQAQSEHV